MQNAELRALVRKIHTEHGLDLSKYKLSFIQRRIATRLRATGAPSYAAYMRLLDDEEYSRLLDALTVNLTFFFRDTSTFEALREEVLRPLITQRRAQGYKVLRVWSAGCAGGEEPYSVAIMLHQLLQREIDQWDIRILGTDIDEKKLAQARQAVYTAFSFKGTHWPHLDMYVRRRGSSYTLIPEVTRMVHFRRHDLIADAPPGRFDVILCRNVLIYLKRSQQALILKRLHRALRSNGVLVLGKTEILPPSVTNLYTPLNLKEHIYRKLSRPST